MPEARERISEFSAAKRQLLEKLAAAAAAAKVEVPALGPVPDPTAESNVHLSPTAPGYEQKTGWQQFYNNVNYQLDTTPVGKFSFFLNYGYVPSSNRSYSVVELPEFYINKNSARLVLELIGDCALTGRKILDVGCGRGGTVLMIREFYDAAEIDAIDICPRAIAFCQANHRYPGVRFRVGDAENLPFEDQSFDVVTNVESSHGYPNPGSFHAEVHRVLAPDGHFLYTDLFPRSEWAKFGARWAELGFELERDVDISSNVLLSCDQIAAVRVSAFDRHNDPELMGNFLATPGSRVYRDLQGGELRYRILNLAKKS